MATVQTPPSRSERFALVLSQTIELLAWPEDELDTLIRDRAVTSFGFERFALKYAITHRTFNLFKIWRIYKEIKQGIIAVPGRGVGFLIRWGTRDGGFGFCKRIRYCKRKARFKEQIDALKEMSEETVFTAELLGDRAPDVLEITSEVIQELGDFVGDLLLVPLVARALIYGLDDICPCCKKCNGTGIKDGMPCAHCEGTGAAKPSS